MPELVLFNTLGRNLAPFAPLVPGEARVYTCGPTVYNQVHIGNLRTFLFEDLLHRVLARFGYRVRQVMNLTDVDDKTIQGAHDKGVPLDEYTAPFIAAFFVDLDRLHVQRAERYPKATEHVAEMIALIAELIARGHAYEADGSVFFRIASDPDYGKPPGHDLEQARQGERGASDEYGKQDVRDVARWKATTAVRQAGRPPGGAGR